MKKNLFLRSICALLVMGLILAIIVPITVEAETLVDELVSDAEEFAASIIDGEQSEEYGQSITFILLIVIGVPALMSMSKKS